MEEDASSWREENCAENAGMVVKLRVSVFKKGNFFLLRGCKLFRTGLNLFLFFSGGVFRSRRGL